MNTLSSLCDLCHKAAKAVGFDARYRVKIFYMFMKNKNIICDWEWVQSLHRPGRPTKTARCKECLCLHPSGLIPKAAVAAVSQAQVVQPPQGFRGLRSTRLHSIHVTHLRHIIVMRECTWPLHLRAMCSATTAIVSSNEPMSHAPAWCKKS